MTQGMAKWMMEVAIEIAKDDSVAERPVATTLEQRIAVAMIQARAREDRHLAGEIRVQGAGDRAFLAYANMLSERSSALEKIALDMCTKYPPEIDEPAPPPPKNMIVMPN